MTIAGLEFLNNALSTLGIPYEFMEWTSDLSDPYFVGQYSEIPNPNEDGKEEADFLIIGATQNKFLELESVKEKIKNYFTNEGLTTILPNGCGIAVMYESAYPIPSIDEGIHRIQITLKVKEWKGESK